MEATCSECGLQTKIKYKSKKFGNGLESVYFKCRKCHAEFTCYVTDRKTRKLLKENNRLRKKGADLTAADIAVLNKNQAYIDESITSLTKQRRLKKGG